MKICTKCEKEKDLSEFYKATRMKDGYMSSCKRCADAATKIARDRKPAKYKAIRKMVGDQARQRFSDWKREQGCTYCDETEPVCLDLHHLDPTEKEVNPSSLAAHKWERLMEEVKKCIVVCKNCHAKIHNNLPV